MSSGSSDSWLKFISNIYKGPHMAQAERAVVLNPALSVWVTLITSSQEDAKYSFCKQLLYAKRPTVYLLLITSLTSDGLLFTAFEPTTFQQQTQIFNQFATIQEQSKAVLQNENLLILSMICFCLLHFYDLLGRQAEHFSHQRVSQSLSFILSLCISLKH